jgi:Flavin containing amine oxidoreductase
LKHEVVRIRLVRPPCSSDDHLSCELGPVSSSERQSEEKACGREADEPTLIEICTQNGQVFLTDVCVVTIPIGCLQSHTSCRDSSPPSPAAIRPERESVGADASLGAQPNLASLTNPGSGKHLFFDPPLSHDKIEALQQTEMGAYKKVILSFDCQFWPTNVSEIGFVRRELCKRKPCESLLQEPNVDEVHASWLGEYLLGRSVHYHSDGNGHVAVPCLEVVLVGSAGAAFTNCADSAIRRAVLFFLKDAVGLHGLDEDPLQHDKVISPDTDVEVILYARQLDGCHRAIRCIDCLVTRWEENEFSRGAYSHITAFGGVPDQVAATLAEPEYDGHLIFAGEGTVPHCEGSVHAALASGERAAQQALGKFKTLDGWLAPRQA